MVGIPKNNISFLLPKRVKFLNGACSVSRWVLAWGGNKVFSWTEEDGWQLIGRRASDILTAEVDGEGVLLVGRKHLYFWVPGEDCLRWRCRVPGGRWSPSSFCSFNCGRALFFAFQSDSSVGRFYLARVGMRPPQWNTIEIAGLTLGNDDVAGCYETRTDSLWLIDDEWNIYRRRLSDKKGRFEVVGQYKGDFPGRIGICHPLVVEDKIYLSAKRLGGFDLLSDGAELLLEIDIASAGIRLTNLPYWPGLRMLLPLVRENRFDRVRYIMDILEKECRIFPSRERVPFCVLHSETGEIVALVTGRGIYLLNNNNVVGDGASCILPFPENFIRAWKLWSCGEKFLPEIFDTIVRERFCSLLPELLYSLYGDECLDKIFAWARGRTFDACVINHLEYLFQQAGFRARPLVEKHLEDDDPFVVWIATVAAGSTVGENGDSCIWKERRDIPVARLRELLRSGNRKIQKAALEVFSRLRLPGAVSSIGELLASRDPSLVLSAMFALKTMPDADEIDAGTFAQFESLACDNPGMTIRENAFEILHKLPLFWKDDVEKVLSLAVKGTADFHPAVRISSRYILEMKQALNPLDYLPWRQFLSAVDLCSCVAIVSSMVENRMAADKTWWDLKMNDFSSRNTFGLYFLWPDFDVLKDDDGSDFLIYGQPESWRLKLLSLALFTKYFSALAGELEMNNSELNEGEAGFYVNIEADELLELGGLGGIKSFFTRVTRYKLAKLAVEMSRRKEPVLGRRLAVVANAGLSAMVLKRIRSEGVLAETELSSLQSGLQTLAKKREYFAGCNLLARYEAEERVGLRSIVALFSLVANGETAALDRLRSKLCAGEVVGYDLPVILCLEVIPGEREKREFIRDYLLSEKIPLSRKAVFFSFLEIDWDPFVRQINDRELLRELKPFFLDLIRNPEVSWWNGYRLGWVLDRDYFQELVREAGDGLADPIPSQEAIYSRTKYSGVIRGSFDERKWYEKF